MSFSPAATVLLEGSLAELLGTASLAKLQSTEVAARKALTFGQAWQRAFAAELPQFPVSPALLEQPTRSQLLAIVPLLLQATVAEGAVVPIRSCADAQQLAKALRGMRRTAGAHLESGGRAARVLVGRFIFRGGSIIVAGNADVPLDVSDENLFALQGRSSPRAQPNSGVLKVRLGLQGDAVHLSVEPAYDNLERLLGCLQSNITPAAKNTLTFDIATIGHPIVLHHRRVLVKADGSMLESGGGISLIPADLAQRSTALALGLVCVMCVRDGTDPQSYQHAVDALHLDRVRSCKLSRQER